MRSTEEMLNLVRDPASRAQLSEAVRAYQAGAFRAALISVWVTVALDIVAKIRELADAGYPAAQAWTTGLDKAITTGDFGRLQQIEANLLSAARDDFELVSAREVTELRRLYEDRNVCAHPAFVSPDQTFAPTAELVRAHISTAVDTVLRHGPTPGKKALERFMRESKSLAWPASRVDLGRYLESTFLARGSESLRRNLAQVAVKGCLQPPEGDLAVSSRLSEVVHVLDDLRPPLLEAACQTAIRRREETQGLLDSELLRMVGLMGDLSAPWSMFPSDSLSRVASALKSAPHAELLTAKVYGQKILHAEAAHVVKERIEALSQLDFAEVVSHNPGEILIPKALTLLGEAFNFRVAEARFKLLLPLAPYMNVESIRQLAALFKANGEIRNAAGVPPMTEALFESVPSSQGLLDIWRDLAGWLRDQASSPTDYYAYPGLNERIQAT